MTRSPKPPLAPGIQTPTERRLETFSMWSTASMYAAVWCVGIGLYSGLWWLALVLGLTYGGLHAYQMCHSGHAWLCADPGALAGTFLMYIACVWGGSRLLGIKWGERAVRALTAGLIMIPVGHVVVITCSLAEAWLLDRLFRDQIARELEEEIQRRKEAPPPKRSWG